MSFLAPWRPQILSILRIMSALLLLQHGTTKHLGFPATQMSGIDPFSLPGIAGLFELAGGVLLAIGLWSRPVAFVLSGVMAGAYFVGHFSRGFYPMLNGGELAALYCFTFLYLAAAGPGPWSVDAMRGRAAMAP